MSRISRHGKKRLTQLVEKYGGEMTLDFTEISDKDIPTGDAGVNGERNDHLRSGSFHARYDHLYRYTLPLGCTWTNAVDVGCGTGYGTDMLARKNSVVGIDRSIKAIRYATSVYHGPSFVVGTATSLPLNDCCTEVCTAFDVIEHLEDPGKLLDECRRVLKQDGLLFISSPNPANLLNRLKNIFLGIPIPLKSDDYFYHARELRPDEMKEMLSDRGFNLVSIEGQNLVIPGILILSRAFGMDDYVDSLQFRLGRNLPTISSTVIYVARRE